MVSKGQFVGLYWNRITRLHSQVFSPTIIIFSAVERKPGTLSSNNGIPRVRIFWTLLI